MPEDAHPDFSAQQQEERLAYFTLPMSLNYQRNSYKLWESALNTFLDTETRIVFDIRACASLEEALLREYLTRYKLALQPNKHITTWHRITRTIRENWRTLANLLTWVNYDFLKLQEAVQKEWKSGFPYLSGPKIFHYWSFIIQEYGQIKLKNSDRIDIAPDTHITKCSVQLGVISKIEAATMKREDISARWREILQGSGISPIDMHAPLWFWSRNNFRFVPEKEKE